MKHSLVLESSRWYCYWECTDLSLQIQFFSRYTCIQCLTDDPDWLFWYKRLYWTLPDEAGIRTGPYNISCLNWVQLSDSQLAILSRRRRVISKCFFFIMLLYCITGASPSCAPIYFVFFKNKNKQIKKVVSITVLTSTLTLNRRKFQN